GWLSGRQRSVRRVALPAVGIEAAHHGIGHPHGAKRLIAADPGAQRASYGLDELLDLQGQRLATGRLHLVHAQDLAEEVLLDDGGLTQVNPLHVELAAKE